MRASFILLGPMLARFGRVILPNPGGDRIGRRPVDLHVMAMERLGATIVYRNGYYYASAPPRGCAAHDRVSRPSRVMGTENAMLAATLARGTTVIDNAALRAGGGRPHRHAVLDGRAHRAHRRASDRDRGRRAPRRDRAPRHRRSARGRDLRDRRRHHPRRRDARRHRPGAPRRLPRGLRPDGRRLRDRCRRLAAARVRCRRWPLRAVDVRTDPYPGFATDFQAPLSVLHDPGRRRLDHPRDDLRGPPRPHCASS